MFELLAPGGRLAVISFLSLEDRLVKRFFRSRSRPPQMPRRLPIRNEKTAVAGRLIAGPVRPDIVEEQGNPRARSAILRVIEKAA
jgi:16S rRNA (cytosine1402-N4)-methyltransferase